MNNRNDRGRLLATLAGAVGVALCGCSDPAASMIRYMDAQPPDQQVAEWPRVRALMRRPAPEVGTPAPQFALQTLDRARSIDLATFHVGQPKVLIFGSYT